jgi:hypothetical protein
VGRDEEILLAGDIMIMARVLHFSPPTWLDDPRPRKLPWATTHTPAPSSSAIPTPGSPSTADGSSRSIRTRGCVPLET